MIALSGRICLVTGASSGLGAHFARLVAGAGADVVLAARRTDRIVALRDELAALGVRVVAVAMDVTDEGSVKAAYDSAQAQLGIIDTVIANAGVSSPGRSTDVTVEAIRQTFDTNILGVFLTAREGAKRMIDAGIRDSGRGRVVIIGSMGGQWPIPGEAAYCASKAAAASLSRNFAGDWVRKGINVNAIQPGFILTEMAAQWFDTDAGKAQIASFPRKRLQPIESLDDAILYLCSDASASTTGAVLTIDDGQSL